MYRIPHGVDTTTDFFRALAAPYLPPQQLPPWHAAHSHPAHAARCRAAINWTTPPSPSSSCPAAPPDKPIYEPHGRWAWSHGLPIDDPKQLLSLQNGAQCTASIDSGTIADREIKFICRRWKTSKQKEWYGFDSELALYSSDQYLRPLQGDVVPHVIGVHVMPESVSMTMEMPHSSFWIESSPSMPDVLKERVIAAFEKIHARGVLHGDPELRHMLIGADGEITIIDFGMSRSTREHPSAGIESAEPEEFRLEMRKVKYKLDYRGARTKEGDKVDDYLRRVRRNKKISELWKRRAKGERVGPIPQYEEDPEEYELEPPVNAQDFQEDWITASDDTPMRIVVPGQTPEQVSNHVQALLDKIDHLCSTTTPPSPSPSHHPSLSHLFPRRPTTRRHPSPAEEDLIPLSTRHIEGTRIRRDYIRHRHLKNTYISTLSSNPSAAATFASSIDTPENPRSLKPEEYRKIQDSRRQAMLQYTRAPKGILKRRRDDDDGGDLDDHGVATAHLACKKLRFSDRPISSSAKRRTPFSDLPSNRRPVVYSRAYRRLSAPKTRPELVNFTLPSFRTLSILVGSLMPWVHFQ